MANNQSRPTLADGCACNSSMRDTSSLFLLRGGAADVEEDGGRDASEGTEGTGGTGGTDEVEVDGFAVNKPALY